MSAWQSFARLIDRGRDAQSSSEGRAKCRRLQSAFELGRRQRKQVAERQAIQKTGLTLRYVLVPSLSSPLERGVRDAQKDADVELGENLLHGWKERSDASA